jgi:hypothetical protein
MSMYRVCWNTWKFLKQYNILRQSGKVLFTQVCTFHAHENSYKSLLFNMPFWIWHYVFQHTLAFMIKSQYWRDMFRITCFWYSPKWSSLVLQDKVIKQSGMPATPNSTQNLKTSLLTEQCFHIDCHHAQARI